MTKFTVIEGGGTGPTGPSGPTDWESEQARYAFRVLVMELLRALARGNDDGGRASKSFLEFLERARNAKVSLYQLVNEALSKMHRDAFPRDDVDDFRLEKNEILPPALRVIAESLALDNAARGRRSRREDEFESAIRRWIIASEERSRENGWSYLQNLAKSVSVPLPPPNKPRK